MNRAHFAPARGWMNDPNGLVYHDGRYHLFFQYNPEGVTHGNLSWGHAVSDDLVSWEERPVAIWYDDHEEIFSGSIVVDTDNTSGLGTASTPPFIACYTSESRTRRHQAQSLAYSLDQGETWQKYSGNPVLDRGTTDFRDPKIIRYRDDATEYWVMVAVEAQDREVLFYRSDDLLTWEYLSSFGPGGAVGGIWECPDLFPLVVDGTAETRWVLLVSLNPGGVNGGSGTQYFLGDFDGRAFIPNDQVPGIDATDSAGLQRLSWLDYGRDCYAGVTFTGLPDHRRTLIAWMNNWDYARCMPTDSASPQRGRMTLARRLSLVRTDEGVQLQQIPCVPPVGRVSSTALNAGEPPVSIPLNAATRIAVSLGDAAGFAFHIASGDGRRITIAYDAAAAEMTLDRRESSAGFPEEFASRERMPVPLRQTISFLFWLGEESIELFAERGTRVLTELIGPCTSPTIRVEEAGGKLGAVLITFEEGRS